jgi:hypothetical protein
VSRKTDILPLFTTIDIEHMAYAGVALDDYAYVSQAANASGVYEKVSTGTMARATVASNPGRRTRSSRSNRGSTTATSRSRRPDDEERWSAATGRYRKCAKCGRLR